MDAPGLPDPTPTQQALLEEVLKLVNRTGQLGTGSWIRKQDTVSPRPLPSTLLMVHMNIRSWAPGTSSLQDELEKVRKKTFALLVGYDKKEEINLTKEKTKWDLTYTH